MTTDQLKTFWDWFSGAPVRILIIITMAFLIQKITGRAIIRAMNRIGQADFTPGPKRSGPRQLERARTLGSVLKSATNATIWVIATSMVISEFGLNLGPIIASAGVIGVALGLGAQTIVRDVLAGIFMLIEDQYGVGDAVDVMEVSGQVESVGLRITTVRASDDTLWYLRNGEILKIGNKSQPKR